MNEKENPAAHSPEEANASLGGPQMGQGEKISNDWETIKQLLAAKKERKRTTSGISKLPELKMTDKLKNKWITITKVAGKTVLKRKRGGTLIMITVVCYIGKNKAVLYKWRISSTQILSRIIDKLEALEKGEISAVKVKLNWEGEGFNKRYTDIQVQ